jgi:hypothetical protein
MANTIFSQKEIEYIKSQRLARIATATPAALSKQEEQQGEDTSIQPDVVPVGFDFDGDYFYVGGYMGGTGPFDSRSDHFHFQRTYSLKYKISAAVLP